MFKHLTQLHHFLLRSAGYPLMLSSLLACGLLAMRIYLSQTWGYTHMVWNLFLAWIPYLCSLWLARIVNRHPPRQWWLLIIPAMLWLLFLPNAPYLVTDIIHLFRIETFVWWYDIGLVVSFAWTGCFLAIVSLHIVQSLVSRAVGEAGSWLFVLVVVGLTGLGIYLGRFLGWNSWDVLVEPRSLLTQMMLHLTERRHILRMVGVTGFFAAFLFVGYLMFTTTAYWLQVPHTYRSGAEPHGRSPLRR